ncbi:hypothetical protein J4425_01870 [Candidatus Woesearchaeota archaeon]|nr:hypothetical protein [Candidatus Woesearchaeota archaeon]
MEDSLTEIVKETGMIEANSLLSNNPFPDEDFKRIIIEVFYIVRGERLRVQRDPLNFYSE